MGRRLGVPERVARSDAEGEVAGLGGEAGDRLFDELDPIAEPSLLGVLAASGEMVRMVSIPMPTAPGTAANT